MTRHVPRLLLWVVMLLSLCAGAGADGYQAALERVYALYRDGAYVDAKTELDGLLKDLPDPRERAEQELTLQLALGMAWIAL